VRVSTHTSYDQDETAILRLEHASALGAANDVDMGFNSILQAGGGARTIGALSTNGGVGPFIGDTAGGTMGASVNGTTVIIENAATTAGTLTITQSTPASTEVQWNAYFRDGTLNSEFFAPGVNPSASAALNIVKAGSGWATLTLDNNHTGTTTVTGGILQVGRGGVGDTGAAGAAGLTANSGTIVAGTGIIQGNSTINGTLRPGDEAGLLMGTLFVNGSLSLGSVSITSLQVQRASFTATNIRSVYDNNYGTWAANLAGGTDSVFGHLLDDPITPTQHDQLLVTGGLTVTAGGKFALANLGYNPTEGDVFNLADWTGGSLGLSLGGNSHNGGVFRTGGETGTDLDLFELGNGFAWDVSQFNDTGVLIVARLENRQFYWVGDVDGSWSTAGNTNWQDAQSGGNDPGNAPAFTDDVYFTANGASNLSTSLGSNIAVRSVNFGTGTNATSSVSIDTGANTLTVHEGIRQASGSAANSIGGTGGIILAKDQTWTNDSANTLTVSAPISGSSSLTKDGTGTLVLSGTNTYSGSTTITAGKLSVSSEANLGANPGSFNAAQLHLNGGTLETTASFTIDDTNRGLTIGASGGTIETGAGTALTVAVTNPIVLTGNLTKSGDGALYIDSTTTGTGTVTVADGTLGGTGTISGATTVQSGAVLTGATDGTVGELTFAGNLTTSSGSTWLIDLVQDVNGSSDLINVSGGALDLGSATLSLMTTGNFTLNNTYTIATYQSLAGTFSGLLEGAVISNYQISYGSGTNGAITLTAVPEPGTLGMLGLALGGFFFRRIRRRRAEAVMVESEKSES
jgi:autotransporter-associated beta strand protein